MRNDGVAAQAHLHKLAGVRRKERHAGLDHLLKRSGTPI